MAYDKKIMSEEDVYLLGFSEVETCNEDMQEEVKCKKSSQREH